MKLNLLFFLLLPIIILSQTTKTKNDEKKLKTETTTETFEKLKRSLDKVKDNQELFGIYLTMGDLKDKQNAFSDAMLWFDKANTIAQKNKDLRAQFFVKHRIAMSFLNTDLVSKADKIWNEALDLTKAKGIINDEIQNYIYQYEILKLRQEKEFCKVDSIYNLEFELLKSMDFDKEIYLFTRLTAQAYDNFKCGDIENANLILANSEKIKNKFDGDQHFYKIELYYIDKGFSAFYNKNNEEASFWFTKALKTAKDRENFRDVNLITENALEYKISFMDSISDDTFLNTFIDYNKNKISESSKIIDSELSKKDLLLTLSNQMKNIYFVSAIFLLLFVVLFFVYYKREKKRIQAQTEKIIRELKLEQKTKILEIDKVEEEIKSTNIQISEQTEKLIYERLLAFEESKMFTERNFTLSNLATILETNNKYVSFIINKYYDENFNEYINTLRLKYIVKLLYEDKSYLSYKISYLSEKSGFSSHSKFTQSFKKKYKIGPSEFIKELKSNLVEKV